MPHLPQLPASLAAMTAPERASFLMRVSNALITRGAIVVGRDDVESVVADIYAERSVFRASARCSGRQLAMITSAWAQFHQSASLSRAHQRSEDLPKTSANAPPALRPPQLAK